VCACIAGASTANAATAAAAPLVPTALPAPLGSELEPNESPTQASPLMGSQRIRASLSPLGDVDYYAFQAHAGDRVYADLVTAADTRLLLLKSDGLTPIEADDDDGTQFALASSIAGAEIDADGVYYLRLEDVRGAAATPAPYDLYLALRAGATTAEVEPNDEFTKPNLLVNGEVSGKYDQPGDKDWFAVKLQAGDSVFLSLDLDPERNGESFDGELGFGLAGDVRPEWPPSILTVDDPNPSEPPDSTPPSEAETMTVSQSGTYYGYVDVAEGKSAAGGETDTYRLAVTVFRAVQPACRTYHSSLTSAFVDGGTTTFPIPVDDPALISRAAVRLKLEETVMTDLDVSLRSPAGTELPLFTDVGESAVGGQRQMDAIFDDFAAMPPVYTSLRPLGLQADSPLASFKGQPTQGTWTLVVKDDTANLPPSAGNLAAAELVLCPEPETPPSPPAGGGGTGTGGGAPPGQAERPAQPPVLSDFAIAPSQFRAARAGPMLLAKRSRRGGALVSYQSSDAAQTHFVLSELEEGRRARRRCVRPTALNSSRKPCVRRVKVITFVRDDAAGRNRFGFSGRVGARKLPPGEYQLQARAYTASGLTSAPVGATFTVLPPAPRQASGSRR